MESSEVNRREFNHDKASVTGGRGYDDQGVEFWGYALMSWERADVVRIMKQCAKAALDEYLKRRGVEDTSWHQHEFMGALGKKATAALKKREQAAYARGQKRKRFKPAK